MIKIYFGNDTIKIRTAAQKEVEKFVSAGGRMEFVDSDSYEEGMLLNLAMGNSLFGDKIVFLLEYPLANTKVRDDLEKNFSQLEESEQLFVVIEGALKAEQKKLWSKCSRMEEFKAEAGESFNVFALGDAILKRDRKALWLIWSEARLLGIAPEELVGIIWWQLKSLRLAGLTSSAEEAGMKGFPYQKSKRGLAKFAVEDPEKLSRSLIETYHQSRLGYLDLDMAMERWLLRL